MSRQPGGLEPALTEGADDLGPVRNPGVASVHPGGENRCPLTARSRDRGRASAHVGLEQATVLDRLDAANEATEQVATGIEQRCGDVIRIDTDRPLSDLRAELLGAVRAGLPDQVQ